jgi:hypothetical protein
MDATGERYVDDLYKGIYADYVDYNGELTHEAIMERYNARQAAISRRNAPYVAASQARIQQAEYDARCNAHRTAAFERAACQIRC